MGLTPGEMDELHRGVVDRFVVRARRIQAHSLFRDEVRVRAYVVGEMKVRFDAQGKVLGVRSPVPEEEHLESLAARVRPVILQRDGVHLPKVIKSVQHFAEQAGNQEIFDHLTRTGTAFARETATSGTSAFAIQIQNGADSNIREMTDLELADSWLYGDVVHADATHVFAKDGFGVDERFRAAVGVYIRAAVNTVGVLRCIEQLRADGVAVHGDEAFTVDVVAKVVDGFAHYFGEGATGRVFVAPVGTPPPPFPKGKDRDT